MSRVCLRIYFRVSKTNMNFKNKYRRKTRIERLFSFSHYKKKQGGDKISLALDQAELSRLKSSVINIPNDQSYQYKYYKKIDKHLTYLETEFNGQSELIFYHAKLIVLIRREVDTETNFSRFTTLWDKERDFLLSNLSLRWIISAVDTFLDYSKDELLKSSLLSVLLLVNTCKLYETEELMLNINTEKKLQYNITNIDEIEKNGEKGTKMLFDGIPAFRLNKSDTLLNMRKRMEATLSNHQLAYAITIEVFRRLHKENTVYHRLADQHTHQRTKWW